MGKYENHPLVMAAEVQDEDEVNRILREYPSWKLRDDVLQEAYQRTCMREARIAIAIGDVMNRRDPIHKQMRQPEA